MYMYCIDKYSTPFDLHSAPRVAMAQVNEVGMYGLSGKLPVTVATVSILYKGTWRIANANPTKDAPKVRTYVEWIGVRMLCMLRMIQMYVYVCPGAHLHRMLPLKTNGGKDGWER